MKKTIQPELFFLILFLIFGMYIGDIQKIAVEEKILEFFAKIPGFSVFRFFTMLGDLHAYIFWLCLFTYLFLRKGKIRELFLLYFVLLTATLGFICFKNLFMRIRPIEFFRIRQLGYSFPSGHSTMSFALFYTCYLLLNKGTIYDRVMLIIPVMIALSRLIMGVHWPTDVLFGSLFGIVISRLMLKKLYWGKIK